MKVFNTFITAVCVLFLIKLRWPKTKSLYDRVLQEILLIGYKRIFSVTKILKPA